MKRRKKILLVGPMPPPHGGISVHVAGLERKLTAAGVHCRVLDTAKIRPGIRFLWNVMRHSLSGWTLHVHTNGHNTKSWLVALTGTMARQSVLTLHSGMAPAFVDSARGLKRRLVRMTSRLYQQIICVNPEIRRALIDIGVERQSLDVLPAFLGAEVPATPVSPEVREWMADRRPVLSTVLFFRPEYGFDVLAGALEKLQHRYPQLGCIVMGSGEQRVEAEARLRDAGLNGNVLFLGDVDHEQCLAIFAASDVFIRATLEDGDSISVREALAMGTTVVASRVGERPAGVLLFRAGDSVELAEKLELAIARQRGGSERARGCADRLMTIYA